MPSGTELDLWNGKTFVSLVGFRFLATRVWGIAFPFHRNFEEVNLRFYVRRKVDGEWRRGVVFIQEIVPRRGIAWTARWFYNENYIALPMAHEIDATPASHRKACYSWKNQGGECRLDVEAVNGAEPLAGGSEAEFILEHYWGYSRQRDGSTVEYQVEHPVWRIFPVTGFNLSGNFCETYGPVFGKLMQQKPASIFWAEGSPVIVRKGVRLQKS